MFLTVKSGSRNELIDITDQIQREINAQGVKNGLCLVYAPHTTAAVTINENADSSVKRDILKTLSRVFPNDPSYEHQEGNSDAHVKSSLVGVSETLAIENGRLVLGTWQGVFFCEFDGPRTRKVLIRIL